MFSFNVTKNFDFNVIKNVLNNSIDVEISETMDKILVQAKANAPVRTGNLKNSLSKTKDGYLSYTISSKLTYAPYVELGTRKQPAQPYLYPAYIQYVNLFPANMRKKIESIYK